MNSSVNIEPNGGKKRLRDSLPHSVRMFSRRMIVRLVRSTIHLTQDVLNIATKNGLDLEREWTSSVWWSRENNQHNRTADLSTAWGVQDFLFLMDLMTGGENAVASPNCQPESSIIVPAFNNVRYTFQCLRSLIAELDSSAEIIIVNNGSDDETQQLLSFMKRKVCVLNNADNLGFVKACNQGAAIAKGKYLVFLNNDTLVQPGWLKHLVQTADDDPAVGAVGSMLLYPDGTVQEAGGVVWKNGDAANYGRGASAVDRKFRFAREVDYCSAASLLVRKDVFERLGGFDERYSPAFYEDTDLCFGIRSIGYKVVYQPLSRVVHYEGATAGTDIRQGFKRYQEINRIKFREKWREVLDREHADKNVAALEQAANRQRGPKIIVFDHSVPTPDKDSGSVRMYELLKGLRSFSQPTFIPAHVSLSDDYENLLGQAGVEIVPRERYKHLIKSGGYEVAILSRAEVAAELFASIRKLNPRMKIIFDTVDLHFLRLAREHEQTGNQRFAEESAAVKAQELRLAASSDQVWCVSQEDKEVLSQHVPGARIEIIPNVHSVHRCIAGFEERDDLLMIGNFNHRPNKDALSFYVNEILPELRKLLPVPRLSVVGSNMSADIFDYGCDCVSIVGYVADLTPLLQRARLLVAPLRFGAGMKGKIGQALSYGLPVITTSIGNEGFRLVHGHDGMIADDAAAFARAVSDAYTDAILWSKLSENGRKHVQEGFSPPVVRKKLYAAVSSLLNSTVPK